MITTINEFRRISESDNHSADNIASKLKELGIVAAGHLGEITLYDAKHQKKDRAADVIAHISSSGKITWNISMMQRFKLSDEIKKNISNLAKTKQI